MHSKFEIRNSKLILNTMAKTCDICGRKSSTKDASRSHSNIKTLKRQYLNLQSKKIDGKAMLVCTRCIKTQLKVKKVKV